MALVLAVGEIFAQDLTNISVNGSYENKPVREILTSVQSQVPLYFVYNEEDIPSGSTSILFEESSIEEALGRLLGNTDLGYSFYRDYVVLIAQKEFFEADFSVQFFKALEELSEAENVVNDDRIYVGDSTKISRAAKVRITGTVVGGLSEEPIIGATLYFPQLRFGGSTDVEARVGLELPVGRHEVIVQFVGYEPLTTDMLVFGEGDIVIRLEKGAINLQEVVVEGQAQDINVSGVQSSTTTLDLKKLKKMPSFLGEPDIVKSLQLQSGISAVGEGAAGFNVRGGGVDQNLIMQDEGFIFNSSHALGFFSTFNSDLISDVTLYKSIIPATEGGRLASVLDVSLKEGNREKFQVQGGIGLATSTLTLEGPVFKEKSSFIMGFRSTYSDWVLRTSRIPEVENSSSSFYDLNIGYSHSLNDRNKIKMSLYSTSDSFNFNKEFGFNYGTYLGQISYESSFSPNFFSKLSIVGSEYSSDLTDFEGVDGSKIETGISYWKVKELLSYSFENGLKVDGGFKSIMYKMAPQILDPRGDVSLVEASRVQSGIGLESAFFLNGEWDSGTPFTISAGVYFVNYANFGVDSVNVYTTDELASAETFVESKSVSKNERVARYNSLEPRLSLRYNVGVTGSVKAGYSRTAQFVNQISNFSSPTPTNIWQISTPNIAPTRSHNYSIGYYRNFGSNLWETSVEGYYREVDRIYDYKDFAELNVNPSLETQLVPAEGKAQGLEFSLKKKRGIINGSLSYTLSKTIQRSNEINNGAWYRSNFDKPHDLTIVTIFQPNQRHSFTFNFNYQTGRPVTAPVGVVRTADGFSFPIYSNRNELRIQNYHRLDVAYAIGQGFKRSKKFKSSWVFSVYNLYGRRNAYSVFFEQLSFGEPKAKRFSVLGAAFPSISYKFQML